MFRLLPLMIILITASFVFKHEQMESVVGWRNVLWDMVDGMIGPK